jgi:hypothetical protein
MAHHVLFDSAAEEVAVAAEEVSAVAAEEVEVVGVEVVAVAVVAVAVDAAEVEAKGEAKQRRSLRRLYFAGCSRDRKQSAAGD